MKLLLALLIVISAFGQDAVPQAKPAEPAPGKTEATAPAKDAAEQTKPSETAVPASAASTAEQWLTGEIDLGYRYVPNVGGNPLQYRSVVNLGEGPKLFGLNFSIIEPKHKYFDRIDVWATSWGGDPYNT